MSQSINVSRWINVPVDKCPGNKCPGQEMPGREMSVNKWGSRNVGPKVSGRELSIDMANQSFRSDSLRNLKN